MKYAMLFLLLLLLHRNYNQHRNANYLCRQPLFFMAKCKLFFLILFGCCDGLLEKAPNEYIQLEYADVGRVTKFVHLCLTPFFSHSLLCSFASLALTASPSFLNVLAFSVFSIFYYHFTWLTFSLFSHVFVFCNEIKKVLCFCV